MSKSEELDYFGNPVPVATLVTVPQDNNATEILGNDDFFSPYSSSLEVSNKVSPSAPDEKISFEGFQPPKDNNSTKILGNDDFFSPYSSSLEVSNKISPSAPDEKISFKGFQPSEETIIDLVRSYLTKISPTPKYGPRADQKHSYDWFDSQNGYTWKDRFPLHRAAMRGEVDEIKRLCASGQRNPNEKMADWFDSEPLGWAASFGELKAVIALIECGADPLRPPNKAGYTPLYDAEREKHESTIAFLKWYKIQVKGDIRKKCAQTSERQKLEYIFNFEEYQNLGPKPHQSPCCTTFICLPCFLLFPSWCCATWGCSRLLDLLTSLPCKYCFCSPCDPQCSLGFATTHGQLHTVMVLVKNGADPSLTFDGQNAFTDSKREKHFHILEWLDDWEAMGRPTPAKMNR